MSVYALKLKMCNLHGNLNDLVVDCLPKAGVPVLKCTQRPARQYPGVGSCTAVEQDIYQQESEFYLLSNDARALHHDL